MNVSVSTRLVIWLAVPLTLLALAGGLVDYFINEAPALASDQQRLNQALQIVLSHWQRSNATAPALTADESQWLAQHSIEYVVRDAQQRPLAGNPQLPLLSAGSDTPLRTTVSWRQRSVAALAFANDAITITVVGGRSESEARFHEAFLRMLGWNLLQLLLTLALVWIGVRWGLRPVRKISRELAARSPEDLSPLPETVPTEIKPLAQAMNRLLQMLHNATQSRQKFIVDTAHQLRTPITGIAAQLDLLAEEPAARPIQARLKKLQDSIRQLAHATNQLLNLARAESAAQQPRTINRPVELKRLADEVVGRFINRALLAQIDLGADTQAAEIQADAALLDDLLSNLIDNALKYTPAGGMITVSSGSANGQAFLEVDDNGRGIAADERARVRQRFYRSPDSPAHGSGLGLAIVEEIAQIYAASLSIATGSSGQGTCVRVQFPANRNVSR